MLEYIKSRFILLLGCEITPVLNIPAPRLYVCLLEFVGPTLCTTAMIQRYVVVKGHGHEVKVKGQGH